MTGRIIQELKELKDTLLEGVKTATPKAKECIPGTRATLLADIENYINELDGVNTLWIRGAPGCGKSAISLSIKSQLLHQGRLITYFRFDRNESATTTLNALWRRVAYDLAPQSSKVRSYVLRRLRDGKVDLDSSAAVFSLLVEAPMSLILTPVDQTLVIIIDALDECAPSDRRELLQILGRFPRLPTYFKLLVTSREERDIARTLSSMSITIDIPSSSFLLDNPRSPASFESSKDIRTFLEGRFSEIRTVLDESEKWPGSRMIIAMVDRAAGNFMWATTAINLISNAVDKEEQLMRIMDDVPSSRSMKPLYSLYSTILKTAFADDDPQLATLRTVLGIMVCAKRSLSDDEYTKLPTQFPIRRNVLQSIREGLGSVIVVGDNLRFVHKSFDDFLRSEECPLEYAISIDESHHLLTTLCLKTMGKGLHFNLCGLVTSCMKNADVPDIKAKIWNNIPALLSYSCCFWSDHPSLTPFDDELMSELKSMVLDKLLYWFEAMSLLKEINRVSYSLLSLLQWSHPSPDDELKNFIRDARQFIAAFGSPIAQSAPHIYISALPFAPKYSSVAQQFLPRFPRILELSSGKPIDWPPCTFASKHHTSPILSVAVSQDEKSFVSGSEDGTICICDSETGNLISGPFNVGDLLWHFFLDSDGRCVWTLSNPGRLVSLDVETGEKHLDLETGYAIGCCSFDGDQNHIMSVSHGEVTLWRADTGERLRDLDIGNKVHLATLSSNGCYAAVVLDNDRGRVSIWHLVSGGEIRFVQGASEARPPFKHTGHIIVVSFSVDGNFVASGSLDGTILIWDTRTGDTLGPPLDTNEWGSVQVVAYSHENHLLISGHINTVVVWNTATREALLSPLNNIRGITSINLSRDGRRALIGSCDGTVKKWDLDRKRNVPVIQPGEGHSEEVWCFAFSPCGKMLASIGLDRIIRFWDADTGELLYRPIGFAGDYSQILFSPDGSRIVAFGPLYKGIRVWVVPTGELVVRQDLGNSNDDYICIRLAAFRSTDTRLVTCSCNGAVRVWDLEDSAPPPVVVKLPSTITLSPDGLTVIVRNNHRYPHHYMWCTVTCQPYPLAFVNEKYLRDCVDVYYSHTKQSVLIESIDSTSDKCLSMLQVRKTRTGDLVAGPSTLDGEIRCLAFSPDGFLAAFAYYPSSNSNTTAISVWDTRTGCITSTCGNMHTSGVTALAFSPSGDKLVSGSRDSQIRIWNTAYLVEDSQLPVNFMHDGGLRIQDGWVLDVDGKLGFWVPGELRDKLTCNGNVAVIGGDRSGITTHVDLTRFRYGEKWMECFDGGK